MSYIMQFFFRLTIGKITTKYPVLKLVYEITRFFEVFSNVHAFLVKYRKCREVNPVTPRQQKLANFTTRALIR